MWTLEENSSNDDSDDGDSDGSGSWSNSSKSTFIDLNAKMYRNPNAALEILPTREQQRKNNAVSEQGERSRKTTTSATTTPNLFSAIYRWWCTLMCVGFSFLRFQWVEYFRFNKTGLFLLDILPWLCNCNNCASAIHWENAHRAQKEKTERKLLLSNAREKQRIKLYCFRFSLDKYPVKDSYREYCDCRCDQILPKGNKLHWNLSGAWQSSRQ